MNMPEPRLIAECRRQYRASGRATLPWVPPAQAMRNIQASIAALAGRDRPLHASMLSGVHNPWGYASRLLDSWAMLDLCESAQLLDVVETVLGPDIVLWDSALWLASMVPDREVKLASDALYWPVTPLAGTLVALPLPDSPASVDIALTLLDVQRIDPQPPLHVEKGLLLIRYMPSTSHFERDPAFPAHQAMARHDPLINYANRPLWLVRGQDHANNDFVTGFDVTVPSWS